MRTTDQKDASSHDADLLDREVLNELLTVCGHDPAFVSELVDTFVDRAKTLGLLCHESLSTGDLARVVSLAHEIKSSSGQLGAHRLQAASRTLETCGLACEEDLKPLVDRLAVEIQLASDALVAFKDSLGSKV